MTRQLTCTIARPHSTSESCDWEAVIDLTRVRPCGHIAAPVGICDGHARELIGTTMPLPGWCPICRARGHIRWVPGGKIPTVRLRLLWWRRWLLRYPTKRNP